MQLPMFNWLSFCGRTPAVKAPARVYDSKRGWTILHLIHENTARNNSEQVSPADPEEI
jgi:hypothetical protein